MKKNIGIIFESFLCLLGLFGILIEIGVFSDNIDLNLFNYYTIISNVICFIYLLIKIIYKINNKEFIPRFKGSIIMCIIVTGLIFHFLLRKEFSMTVSVLGYLGKLGNRIVHYYIPIGICLDYYLFDNKGSYKKIDPFIWTIIPYIYFIYIIIVGKFRLVKYIDDSYYPYFFVDFDKIGVLGVVKYVIIINIFFLILGYIIYYIDKKLVKNK